MNEILITVRGEAEARVAPEHAVVSAALTSDGPDRAGVVEAVARLVSRVGAELDRLRETGAVSEWSSAQVSVWNERPWNADGRQLDPVHHATVEVRATFAELDEIGPWLTAAAEADGIRIASIDWRLTPATRAGVESDTATAAVGRAVARATAYAGALGRTAVEPIELADVGLLGTPGAPGASERGPALFARTAADAGPQGLDLRPADIVVTATVDARFRAV